MTVTTGRQDDAMSKYLKENVTFSLDAGDMVDYVAMSFELPEIYGDGLRDVIRTHFDDPEELFTAEELEAWALANGFTHEPLDTGAE